VAREEEGGKKRGMKRKEGEESVPPLLFYNLTTACIFSVGRQRWAMCRGI